MRELVVELREGLAKTCSRVRDVAEHSLSGLAEALRGADFSSLQEISEPAKEREVERTYERDIGDDFGL